MNSQEVVAFRFRYEDRIYTLELDPLALSVDGQQIVKLEDGSQRKIQDSQLKVLKYLLEHPNQYHLPKTIAGAAGLDAHDAVGAIRTHIHWLRSALGDVKKRQLICTRASQQDEEVKTAYGLFAEVEPVTRAEVGTDVTVEAAPVETDESAPAAARTRWGLLRRVVGWALIVVSLICLYLLIRERMSRGEPRQRQITTNSADAPVKAMSVSPDGSYIAYAEKTGEGGKTNCKLWRQSNGETVSVPVLRNSEIFRLSWFDSATLLVSGKIGEGETGGVWLVPILAGSAPPFRVSVNQDEVGEAAALDQSHIAFVGGNRNEIWLTAISGQPPRLILRGERGDDFSGLVWLDGGRRLLFDRLHLAGNIYRITVETLQIASGQTSVVIPNNPRLRAGCATPDGRFYYALEYEPPDQNDTSLWQMKIDPATGNVTQAASVVAQSTGTTVYGLSTDTAGHHLVMLKGPYQADVWIGSVNQTTGLLAEMRRLTHDDSNDLPTAWTPDGESVLFHSNRGGKYAIYKQNLGSAEAERIIYGDEDYRGARFSPDGRLFYLARHGDWQQNKRDSVRLKVSAPNGDNPRVVYDRYALLSVRCPRAQAKPCVMGQREILSWSNAGELIFRDLTRDEPGKELRRIGDIPLGQEYWDVSPDGSLLAVVVGGTPDATIRILGLDRTSRDVIVKGRNGLQSIDWAADGRGWYVSSRSARSADLLYVDPDGNSRVLWKSADGFETWGVPSPDGSHLAILEWTVTGNVWSIDEPAKQIGLGSTLRPLAALVTGLGGLGLLFWGQLSTRTWLLRRYAAKVNLRWRGM